MQEIIFRIVSKEDAKSINDISKNELGYSDCTESLVLQKIQKIDFENEVVFVAEYKNKVIGFIHAQIYDVLYYESMVNILGLAVDSKFTKNGTKNSNCFELYKSSNNSSVLFSAFKHIYSI